MLITEEMVRMLQSDAVAYPVAPVHGLKAPAMHAFTDDELVQVRAIALAVWLGKWWLVELDMYAGAGVVDIGV